MVAVNDFWSKVVEKLSDQAGLRDRHRKIAAIEMLQGGRSQHKLRGFHPAFKLRRYDPHIVPAAAKLLFIRAYRPGHAAHVRKIRVGEHHDFHGRVSSAKAI